MYNKLAFVLALVTATTTISLASATNTSLVYSDGYGIKWTGVIIAGEPKAELYGTVDEIFEQILAINPSYIAQPLDETDKARLASPVYKEGDPAKHKLTARQQKYHNIPTPTCRVMATGNSRSLDRLISRLEYLGGVCEAPQNACRRVGCWYTTAGYLCGENGHAAVVACTDVSRRMEAIKNGCCPLLWDPKGRPISGHIYHEKYSIWAGYGNCNHGEDRTPSFYTYPGGRINGICTGPTGPPGPYVRFLHR
ncbi:hypothetical protein QBC40DRAFT_254275 [Triangularia verruculosa]|uniref:Secreted protein n=1 Tax=Triangularia verruculosa TaxID=2587418 RepID=A0AAN6XH42_9PEZI|nr:hypothetical protein QBC40DRAFT_254275 [Triangularia verruculosa]